VNTAPAEQPRPAMETRTCTGKGPAGAGCLNTFRVLVTSPEQFCGPSCRPGGIGWREVRDLRKSLPKSSMKRRPISQATRDLAKREAVEKALRKVQFQQEAEAAMADPVNFPPAALPDELDSCVPAPQPFIEEAPPTPAALPEEPKAVTYDDLMKDPEPEEINMNAYSATELARRLEVDPKTIFRVIKKAKLSGKADPGAKRLKFDEGEVRAALEDAPRVKMDKPATKSVPKAAEPVAFTLDYDGWVSLAKLRAKRKAERTYAKTISSGIERAKADGDEKLELALMRHYFATLEVLRDTRDA